MGAKRAVRLPISMSATVYATAASTSQEAKSVPPARASRLKPMAAADDDQIFALIYRVFPLFNVIARSARRAAITRKNIHALVASPAASGEGAPRPGPLAPPWSKLMLVPNGDAA